MKALLVCLLAVVGCNTTSSHFQADPDAKSLVVTDGLQLFETQVKPILNAACGACHATGSEPSNGFAVNYDWIIRAWFGSGDISSINRLLLFKMTGAHTDGPALDTENTAIILEWIDLEKAERL